MKKQKIPRSIYLYSIIAIASAILSAGFFMNKDAWGGIIFLTLVAVCAIALYDDIKKARKTAKESSAEAEADAAKKAVLQQVNEFLDKDDYAGLSDWLSTSEYSVSGLDRYFQEKLTYTYMNNTSVDLPQLKKITEADTAGKLFPYVCLAIEKILPSNEKVQECYLALIDIWKDEPRMLDYYCLVIAAIYEDYIKVRQRLVLDLEKMVRQKISYYQFPATIKERGRIICNRKIVDYKKYFDVFAQSVTADCVSYWLFVRPGDSKRSYVTYSLDGKFPMANVMRGPLPRLIPTQDPGVFYPNHISGAPIEKENHYRLFTIPINRANYLNNMHRRDCKRYDRFAKPSAY